MDDQNLNSQISITPSPQASSPMQPSQGVFPTPPQIADHVSKKKGHWLMVVVFLVLIVAGFVVWIYIDKMNFMTEVAQDQTLQNGYTQPEEQFSAEIEQVDMGNLDVEFQEIDQDLNSL